VRITGQ